MVAEDVKRTRECKARWGADASPSFRGTCHVVTVRWAHSPWRALQAGAQQDVLLQVMHEVPAGGDHLLCRVGGDQEGSS